jgi:hypothetical protein
MQTRKRSPRVARLALYAITVVLTAAAMVASTGLAKASPYHAPPSYGFQPYPPYSPGPGPDPYVYRQQPGDVYILPPQPVQPVIVLPPPKPKAQQDYEDELWGLEQDRVRILRDNMVAPIPPLPSK